MGRERVAARPRNLMPRRAQFLPPKSRDERGGPLRAKASPRLGHELSPHPHSCRRSRAVPRTWALCKHLQRSPSHRPSGLWHPEAGQLVPCKQPVSCHCKQLVSGDVVTAPKPQCDCPVTRYPAAGLCHLILGKQCSENGQAAPRLVRVVLEPGGLGPT